MGFKVTYADGQVTEYDDNTYFVVQGGTLMMGAVPGKWTHYVSPSEWSSIDAEDFLS